jgi:MoaA/NifB/PqqE/SkfB family radical SAM enzyme
VVGPLLVPEPPDVLSVEITTRCNFKCKMCALVTGGTRSSQEPGHLEESLWPRILEAARAVGHVNVNGWGENFSHPGFLGFLEDLDRLGVSTNFSTNGTYLTPPIVERLGRLRWLKHINVSIDSPDPKIFRTIRGGSLAAVLRGLEALVAGLPRPERITVSSVVMESNVASLSAFPALLSRLGVQGFVLQGLVDGTDRLGAERLLPRPEILAVVEGVRQECARRGISVLVVPYLGHQLQAREPAIWSAVPLELRAAAGEGDPGDGGLTRQCSSPWDHVFINKDGLVLPCCNCPPWEQAAADSQGVMGDLKTQSFQEVWHGERFQRFRQQLLEGPIPSICQTCTVTSTGRHFLRLYAAEIVWPESRCRWGEVRLVVRNVGEATWTRSTGVRVGTTAPRDRPSALQHPSWLLPWRVGTFQEERVPPGGRATFGFKIQARPKGWQGSEAFQLVVDGICWLPGTRFDLRPAHPGRHSSPHSGSATRERSYARKLCPPGHSSGRR